MKKFVLAMIVALAGFGATLASAADIAILNSSNYTAEFFQRRYGQDGACTVGTYLGRNEYERYYRGWKYVLDGQPHNALVPGLAAPSAPIAYDILTDADITEQRLSSVKILILSNTASMSSDQSRIIQQWVLKGGKLIATYGSGYKDILTNEREDDRLKAQKGSTGGLHELWHDPWTKAFGTQALSPVPGVDVLVLKNVGPTDVPGWTLQPTLSYGAEANLLVPRPEHYRDALAFLKLTPNSSKFNNPYPAILLTKASRGTVVYFAYAPEFIVSLVFDLAGHCGNDGNYKQEGNIAPGPQANDVVPGFGFAELNRVQPQLLVMKRTLDFMINGN